MTDVVPVPSSPVAPPAEDVPLPTDAPPPVDDPAHPEPTAEATDRDAVIRASYQEAGKFLRQKYAQEADAFRVAYCAEHGVAWAPRPTPQQEAINRIRELAAANSLSLADILEGDADGEGDE